MGAFLKGKIMLPITKLLTTFNRTVRSNRSISYIVIHWVGGVSSAKNNAAYFKNNKLNSSAHYFVDDTTIYQSVEDKDVAWHCGTTGVYYHSKCRNANSIGIEMCLDRENHISETTIANTTELVQYLMSKYSIPENNVIRHYDVTHKLCPVPYIDTSKWADLKAVLVGTKKINSSNTTATMTVIAKSGLNVRKTYSANSKKLGALPYGIKVEVQKLGKKWARITYKGEKGYVYKQYLK